MNRYSFIGNLGRDAEMRTLDSGSTAISFTVAVTEKYTDRSGNKQETTTWVSCTLWRTDKQSTAIANYLKKGQKVLVEGKPSVRAYDKQDGTSAASLDVKVDNIELLGGAPADSAPAPPPASGPINAQHTNAWPANSAPPAAPPKAEEDLPF
jgi:single-strand DNA-binding protein